jgi:hypothetical protein
MTARTSSGESSDTAIVRAISVVGLTGIALFTGILAMLHVLRSDLDPVERMMSEYAVGTYGFLMTLAFLSLAVATVALVIGLAQTVPESIQSRAGLALVSVFAAGMIAFAIFPIGVGETVDSTSDLIHRGIAPIVFFGLTIGIFLISRRFRSDERWSSLYMLGLFVTMILLIASTSFFVSYGAELGFEGVSQRIFIAAALIWFFAVALKIREIAAPTPEATR